MQLSPDQIIIACPRCTGLAKYGTLSSLGNLADPRCWTDGKVVYPSSCWSPPVVVMCRHCGECYWLDEAEKVGTVDPLSGEGRQVDPLWVAAEDVREPTEEEYYRALEMGLAKSPEQQKQLRILAWWRRNDAVRDAPQAPAGGIPVAPGPARTNLEALAQLFDEGDEHHDRLMKAEVLRELGEFESAKQVLSRVHSSDLAPVVRQLQSLCDGGDTCVRELDLERLGKEREERERLAREESDRRLREFHEQIQRDGRTCTHCRIKHKRYRLRIGLQSCVICQKCGWPQQPP